MNQELRMLTALNDFVHSRCRNINSIYKTILNSEEYKNGELSTDFLKRYDMIDKLSEDLIKKEKEDNKCSIAAAIIHSEYFKSRVKIKQNSSAQMEK